MANLKREDHERASDQCHKVGGNIRAGFRDPARELYSNVNLVFNMAAVKFIATDLCFIYGLELHCSRELERAGCSV